MKAIETTVSAVESTMPSPKKPAPVSTPPIACSGVPSSPSPMLPYIKVYPHKNQRIVPKQASNIFFKNTDWQDTDRQTPDSRSAKPAFIKNTSAPQMIVHVVPIAVVISGMKLIVPVRSSSPGSSAKNTLLYSRRDFAADFSVSSRRFSRSLMRASISAL